MEDMVIPAKGKNPDHMRLDGKPEDSQEKCGASTFGKFKHCGRTWKVNSDTYYLPLQLAYDAAIKGTDPFVEGVSLRDKTPILELIQKLKIIQCEQQKGTSKYLYIYLLES